MSCRAVLFPDPLGPTIAVTSPDLMTMLRLFKICREEKRTMFRTMMAIRLQVRMLYEDVVFAYLCAVSNAHGYP